MNNSQRSVTHFQENDYRTIEQTMEKLSGGTRRLAAQLTTSATFDSLWNVLTDYDRLNLYIPNLLSSRKIYKNNWFGIFLIVIHFYKIFLHKIYILHHFF